MSYRYSGHTGTLLVPKKFNFSLRAVKLRKGYFEATRGYVIYSPRAQPEANKSHIHEVPQNNWLIFHTGEVSHGQGINSDMILFVVLKHVR